jgi:hypothetical protein
MRIDRPHAAEQPTDAPARRRQGLLLAMVVGIAIGSVLAVAIAFGVVRLSGGPRAASSVPPVVTSVSPQVEPTPPTAARSTSPQLPAPIVVATTASAVRPPAIASPARSQASRQDKPSPPVVSSAPPAPAPRAQAEKNPMLDDLQ